MLWNVVDGFAACRTNAAVWVIDQHTVVIPHEPHADDRIHYLEIYGGAFGGWHKANSFLLDKCNVKNHTIAVEYDLGKAIDWALTCEALVLSAMESMQACCFSKCPHDIMIHANAESKTWWNNVGARGGDHLAISARAHSGHQCHQAWDFSMTGDAFCPHPFCWHVFSNLAFSWYKVFQPISTSSIASE